MEQEYNWSLILKVAVIISLIEAYVFYANISDALKWSSLAIALFLTGIIIYMIERKKSSLFTAMGIVLLVALIVRFLKNVGII